MKKNDGYKILKNLPGLFVGTAALYASAFLSPVNHYAVGFLLMAFGMALWLYFALVDHERNWWDIRGVFSAVWLITIGLASLRLTNYQVPWERKTWYCVAVAYAMFILGSDIGIVYGSKLQRFVAEKGRNRFGKISFSFRRERLFWICFVVTLIGVVCFGLNIAIRGYIPFFSNDNSAYVNFYTKFYLFSVAATMISGLSYYTLRTQSLSVWKKVFLWFSIIYSTFLFPTLVVSRGTFLTSALSLTTVIFYLHRKKFVSLILCAVVIAGFYAVGTDARGYSESQLNEFFEPSHIGGENETNSTAEDGTIEDDSQNGFRLSGSAAFVYSYLTVSHDNFNLAVQKVENYSYGIRQMEPFNVILRIKPLAEAIDNCEYYLVRPHLTTVNIIGDAYYDFGMIGVAVLMLIWAFAFGMVQSYYLSGRGVFSLLTLGATMTPVTLCFFARWMSLFQTWMHWGLILLMFLAAYVQITLGKGAGGSLTEN